MKMSQLRISIILQNKKYIFLKENNYLNNKIEFQTLYKNMIRIMNIIITTKYSKIQFIIKKGKLFII